MAPSPRTGSSASTSWNNKFVKLRLATLADTNTEADARKFVAAWIPVLWGGGSRIEAEKPAAKPATTRSERAHRAAASNARSTSASTAPPAAGHSAAKVPGRLYLRISLSAVLASWLGRIV